jgi:hypothetical protein
MEPIDREVRPIDQPVLATERDRASEQPLEDLAVNESARAACEIL